MLLQYKAETWKEKPLNTWCHITLIPRNTHAGLHGKGYHRMSEASGSNSCLRIPSFPSCSWMQHSDWQLCQQEHLSDCPANKLVRKLSWPWANWVWVHHFVSQPGSSLTPPNYYSSNTMRAGNSNSKSEVAEGRDILTSCPIASNLANLYFLKRL